MTWDTMTKSVSDIDNGITGPIRNLSQVHLGNKYVPSNNKEVFNRGSSRC